MGSVYINERSYGEGPRGVRAKKTQGKRHEVSKIASKKTCNKKSKKTDTWIYGVNASGVEGLKDQHLQTTIQVVQRLGYPEQHVLEAVGLIRESGEDVTYDSLIDTTFEVQQSKDLTSIQTYSHSQNSTVKASDTSLALDGDADDAIADGEVEQQVEATPEITRRAIERRKMELRDAIDALTFQCKICHCSKATILLLPCAHLVSCDDCLMDVRRCPVARCNKVVRGTKEVYFV